MHSQQELTKNKEELALLNALSLTTQNLSESNLATLQRMQNFRRNDQPRLNSLLIEFKNLKLAMLVIIEKIVGSMAKDLESSTQHEIVVSLPPPQKAMYIGQILTGIVSQENRILKNTTITLDGGGSIQLRHSAIREQLQIDPKDLRIGVILRCEVSHLGSEQVTLAISCLTLPA